MKKLIKAFLFALLPLCLVFAGCDAKDADPSEQTSSTNQSTSEKTYVVIATMPSPPVCKKTGDAGIVERINQCLDSAEKSESEASVLPGGWSTLIKFSDGKQVTLAGNYMTIGEKLYSVSPDLEAEIRKIYDQIDAAEEPYS